MKPIFDLFWQICLMRQSPAYVPSDGWFVGLVVVANLLASTIISLALDPDFSLLDTLTSIIVNQAVTAALVLLALSLRNFGNRFITTITAIFGCDLIITACFSLLIPVSGLLGEAAVRLAMLMFLIWSVAVAGFIMHRALQIQLAIGIGVAMGISLMSVTFSQLAIGG